MKIKIIIALAVVFSLAGCGPQNTRNTFQPLMIYSHDNNKSGDLVPVKIQFNTPMVAGDVLTVKHNSNTIAGLTLSGDVKLEIFSLRIRALGDGMLYATLNRKDNSQIGVKKPIKVEKFSPIPKTNTSKLANKVRIKDGAYKMIILNDSAETGYVSKVDANLGNGHAIVTGSKYLSQNPYFSFKPDHLGKQPDVQITLAE